MFFCTLTLFFSPLSNPLTLIISTNAKPFNPLLNYPPLLPLPISPKPPKTTLLFHQQHPFPSNPCSSHSSPNSPSSNQPQSHPINLKFNSIQSLPNPTLPLHAIPDGRTPSRRGACASAASSTTHEKLARAHAAQPPHPPPLSSLSSRVILSLIPSVIVFHSVAVAIASYNTVVALHWLPEVFPVLHASSLPLTSLRRLR
ncbi:UPF0187 protein, chloroplastic-like protein [Cinnamomum micranthum f. kanehirae]|uniref:UPF0187 protein, chloroplastic-like protein n=1 Tax=Cinnamomum micranthum f. kanehirae TaxID=337451 RepID=A0A3S3NDZ0_9MAGN|nr:UPF0187 protein, chloroplastic-like protein [Cinnamomum micranthum f. kanehirae]